MAFEDKEAELGLLLTRMQNQPAGSHELYQLVRQKLNEIRPMACRCPRTSFNSSGISRPNSLAESEDRERQARLDDVVSRRAAR